MKRRVLYIYAMLLTISGLCASCREELCYDHYPTMDLSFSWELEWERDYGMNHQATWMPAESGYAYDELRPETPEWVKMVRYYDDGRISERFFSPEGARIEVEAEKDCSILFYNGDTEYIILSDVASLQDVRASATTRTRAGAWLQNMKEVHNASRTTNPPDVIYSAFAEKVSGVKNHEVRFLPVKMQPLVYTYLISFEFEHGMEYVALARGALGGMAEGVYLRTGVTTEETSIILFDCNLNPKTRSRSCFAQVRSFGVPGFPDFYFGRGEEDITGPFTLNLELKLINGKILDFDFDITDQMKRQPRGGVIRIGGLRIEDEIVTPPTSGFQVDVTDWGDENAEIIDLPIQPVTPK